MVQKKVFRDQSHRRLVLVQGIFLLVFVNLVRQNVGLEGSLKNNNNSLWSPTPPSTIIPLLESDDDSEDNDESTGQVIEPKLNDQSGEKTIPISSVRHFRSRRNFVRHVPEHYDDNNSSSSSSTTTVGSSTTKSPKKVKNNRSKLKSFRSDSPKVNNKNNNNLDEQSTKNSYGSLVYQNSINSSNPVQNIRELFQDQNDNNQNFANSSVTSNNSTKSGRKSGDNLRKVRERGKGRKKGKNQKPQQQTYLTTEWTTQSPNIQLSDSDYSDSNYETDRNNENTNYNFASEIILDTNVGVDEKVDLSDIVTKFLSIVESQHILGENCTPGTDLNLGEGVVDRYAQERFRLEAEVAVNRANMLTRLWKYAAQPVLESEYFLHASLISMLEFDEDIFAAGNCYDKYEYKNYTLFCPWGYRLPEGIIYVKDLAVEYKYLSNSSEWFFIARQNAEKVISNFSQFTRVYNSYTFNDSAHTDRIEEEILRVNYEDGKWSKPYFDCGGGSIWMMTFTVPFFGFKNNHYYFKGTSGIDIDLRRVDIDQCPSPKNATELNIFQNSAKCKKATTKCVAVPGLGFRRGSYHCDCIDGYYYPNVTSDIKYYNGVVIEEEYEKMAMEEENLYNLTSSFECLKCALGCDTCLDDRPCMVTLNWFMRTAILILQSAIIALLPIVGLFTLKYSHVKVVKAASPLLLRFIVLGAFFIYCTTLIMYPSPSVITCTIRVWLREIGFSLAYGALLLKTYRISVIFRVRSAKAVIITDLDLIKRLGIIVAIFTALLVIRTLVAPPFAKISYTSDNLKAWMCEQNWWDHSFTIMELSLLVWGIRLCIVVRRAPNEFNESKFISLAIYNEFLLSLFLNISMLFLQSPANPDLLYIIFFCHVQLTMTLLLCLIFGSKAYMVFRGKGANEGGDDGLGSRMPNSKFLNKSSSTAKSQMNSNATIVGQTGGSAGGFYTLNISGRGDTLQGIDGPEEFQTLVAQLKELRERYLRAGNRSQFEAFQKAAEKIFIFESSPPSDTAKDMEKDKDKRAKSSNNHAQHSITFSTPLSPPIESECENESAQNGGKNVIEETTTATDGGGGGGGGGTVDDGEIPSTSSADCDKETDDKEEDKEKKKEKRKGESKGESANDGEKKDKDKDKDKDGDKKKLTLDFNDKFRFTEEITV